MDTVNLQTFITAAELESFSLAAEQLYLTQPAVSKRVATLEGELGALDANLQQVEAEHIPIAGLQLLYSSIQP